MGIMFMVAEDFHDHKPDFEQGVAYWDKMGASVDGVLGGYGEGTPVPQLDAASSRALILDILPGLSSPNAARKEPYRAMDCGAGIGRITSDVLLPLFPLVELVEPVPSFFATIQEHANEGKDGWKLCKPTSEGGEGRQVRLWKAGIQYFDSANMSTAVDGGNVELVNKVGEGAWPEEGAGLDLIWIQWCVGHLSHDQLVAFMKRAQSALRRNAQGEVEGFIVMKENNCKDDDADGALFTEGESSTTRSDKVFKIVFEEAGLKLVKQELQKGFPKELFPVMSYVLQ